MVVKDQVSSLKTSYRKAQEQLKKAPRPLWFAALIIFMHFVYIICAVTQTNTKNSFVLTPADQVNSIIHNRHRQARHILKTNTQMLMEFKLLCKTSCTTFLAFLPDNVQTSEENVVLTNDFIPVNLFDPQIEEDDIPTYNSDFRYDQVFDAAPLVKGNIFLQVDNSFGQSPWNTGMHWSDSNRTTSATSFIQSDGNGSSDGISEVVSQSSNESEPAPLRVFGSITGLDFKYSSKGWTVLTGVFSFIFAGLGYYIGYSQLLDAKAIGLALSRMDYEKASHLFLHPEASTPCLDSFQELCTTQYVYAVLFWLPASYLVYQGMSLMLSKNDEQSRSQAYSKSSNRNNNASAASSSSASTSTASLNPSVSGTVVPAPGSLFANLSNKKQSAKKSMSAKVQPITEARLVRQASSMSKKIQPGQPWFWPKSFGTLSMDMIAQGIRAFVVEDSYATTNPSQLIAQVVLMALHISFFMGCFYKQSEVGATATNWFADVGYLVIRLSSAGSLAMKAATPLDFMTLAVPYLFCVLEVKKIGKFVRYALNGDNLDEQTRTKYKRQRQIIVWSIIASVGIVAAVSIYIIAQKAFYEECPFEILYRFDVSEPSWKRTMVFDEVFEDTVRQREDAQEKVGWSEGMQCYSWRFDLFLDPACTCIDAYVDMAIFSQCGVSSNRGACVDFLGFADGLGKECDANLGNDCEDRELYLALGYTEEMYQDILDNCQASCNLCQYDIDDNTPANDKTLKSVDRIQDVLTLTMAFNNLCGSKDEHLAAIPSLTKLRQLNILGGHLPELGPEFKELSNLAVFSFSKSTWHHLNPDILKSWQKLQHFACLQCPKFDAFEVLSKTRNPRLSTFGFFGTSTCPDERIIESHFGNVEYGGCFTQNETETCDGYPEWMFQSHGFAALEDAARSECYGGCGFHLNNFFFSDRTCSDQIHKYKLLNNYE